MKTKLMMIGALAATCAVHELAAMPTAEETRLAVPVVKKLLASEHEALKAGRKTRSEVAVAALKLAGETDTVAAKLLLMKGAFVLYIRDGNLEKAAETMNAIKAEIPDVPPQSITNMIEAAHLGASKKEDCARLYKLIGEAKTAGRVETTTEKAKRDLAKLYPGWTLVSEVPQENRKEHASGFWANHRGQDNIVRFHPLNKETPVILKRTVKLSDKNPCLFLKVASCDEDSDFVLSVRVNGKDVMSDRIVGTSDLEPWEDLVVPLFDWRGESVEIEVVAKANDWFREWSNFARIEIAEGNGQEECGLVGVKNGTETVDGYTWSYFVKNGGATVTAAVSPSPKGNITIPATLGGVKVTGIGKNIFDQCKEVASVTIPEGVTSIGSRAFNFCFGLKSVTIPSSVKTIGDWAFSACFQLQTVTMPESLEYIGKGGFINCRSLKVVNLPAKLSVIGEVAFGYCGHLGSVTIPASVTKIGGGAFGDCGELTEVTMLGERPDAPKTLFPGCGKLKAIRVPANAKSWAGMKEWHGIPLVFDGKDDAVARSPADMNGAYCVIDISGGSNAEHYPVSYLAAEPKGGWTDEHKTTKLVLRRIEPGKFKMRGQYEVTLTKPFYCGVFEVTQKQYELVMGNNPSEFKGDMRPVESVSWGMIRGDSAKYNWPSSANVDSSSFIGKIRVRTGLKFDLPTEAQWEYACRAGTTSKFNNGGDSETDLKKLGRCNGNQSDGKGGNSSHHTTVGSYEPNSWGLYDMHGNVWEACLDWRGNLSSGVTDPQGPSSGAVRVARGGCWRSSMSHCVPSYQDGNMSPSDRYDCGIGFRVCIGEPLGDWNNATTTTPKLVKDAFSLNAAPGSITELDLGNVAPLQFVYCPAGKFSMGYKEQPALSKVKDVEITSPFWVSKIPIRADQLELLGLNSITNAETGDAVINDGSIVLEKLPSALKERFGKMLPPSYVFRLPTEAEFEYLQKAEMNDKNAQTNIWGVERLYSGGLVALLDKAPAYGRVDVVRRRNHRGVIMTDLVKVNYENQPDKDPVGWTDDPTWSVFRRGLARNCGGGKLVTAPGGGKYHYSFYFVVAPDIDKLNKFYWK